ncbi:MAG: heavy metal-binding domain-containing protein [Spirochaetaceae bacterium]|nr:heavy metal-binding domain-containing protein [Spirochaetaceae bacterium]HPG27761.1 heavy metal-binding domain-containing protein [Myxococcota bacterium]
MDPGLINLFLAGVMLLLAFGIGSWIESRHFKSIRRREEELKRLPAVTLERLPTPDGWDHDHSGLVHGHVVVSVDHFKRFVASLRQLFGGRIQAYESLMDRGRREAVLRLKEEAAKQGYHAVVNLRLESSRLASARRNGKGTAGIEVFAFGTGIKMRRLGA